MKKVVVSALGSQYDVDDFYTTLEEMFGEEIGEVISKALEIDEHMVYPNIKKYVGNKGYALEWLTQNTRDRSIVSDLYPTHGRDSYCVIGFIISDEPVDREWVKNVKAELESIPKDKQVDAGMESIFRRYAKA